MTLMAVLGVQWSLDLPPAERGVLPVPEAHLRGLDCRLDHPVTGPSLSPSQVTDRLRRHLCRLRSATARRRLRASARSVARDEARWVDWFMDSAVLTLDQARTRVAEASDRIRALGVVRLALFGSVLRGTPRPESDVDVLVSFADGAKTFDHFFTLCELLEEILGRRVELVTTEALSPYIGPKILAEAQDVLRAA